MMFFLNVVSLPPSIGTCILSTSVFHVTSEYFI